MNWTLCSTFIPVIDQNAHWAAFSLFVRNRLNTNWSVLAVSPKIYHKWTVFQPLLSKIDQNKQSTVLFMFVSFIIVQYFQSLFSKLTKHVKLFYSYLSTIYKRRIELFFQPFWSKILQKYALLFFSFDFVQYWPKYVLNCFFNIFVQN
jgi:hypothetical protein